MKKFLIITGLLLLTNIGFASTLCESYSHSRNPDQRYQKFEDKVLSTNRIDFDGTNKPESISFVMKAGCQFMPYLPGSRKEEISGDFELVVKKGETVVSRQSVNQLIGQGKELSFRNNGFDLVFNDYNGDGQLDFPVCANDVLAYMGNTCAILTIDKNGSISSLSDLFIINTVDFSPKEIEQVEKDVFMVSSWSKDGGEFVCYKWDGKKFKVLKRKKQ